MIFKPLPEKDVLGRRVITEIDGTVIFADTWSEKRISEGRVIHSYKLTRDADIIFEYTTLPGKIKFSEFINEYMEGQYRGTAQIGRAPRLNSSHT